MRRVFAAGIIGAIFAVALSAPPASAAMPPVLPFGPSHFGPGPLTCGSTTYIITERGFGADLQVVGSTTILVFRAYGPVAPIEPPGIHVTHCTGEIPDSLGNIDHFDLYVSISPPPGG
jgi:hypothetical protein